MLHCNKQMISFFLQFLWIADQVSAEVDGEKIAGKALGIVKENIKG
jgi:hypothetical protein